MPKAAFSELPAGRPGRGDAVTGSRGRHTALPFGSELPQVVEHVDHVPDPPRSLFDFRREVNAGHGDDLRGRPAPSDPSETPNRRAPSAARASPGPAHLEAVLDEGLGVEEAVKQHLPGRHRHL